MKNTSLKARLHLSLNTDKLEESVTFYEAFFQTPPSKRKADYAKFEVASPPVNLTLNASSQKPQQALSHLGIQVDDSESVQRQSERLKKLGMETKVEDKTTCCYGLQDKVWATDPNGNAWETYVLLEDADKKMDKGNSSVACCNDGSAVCCG